MPFLTCELQLITGGEKKYANTLCSTNKCHHHNNVIIQKFPLCLELNSPTKCIFPIFPIFGVNGMVLFYKLIYGTTLIEAPGFY